MSLAEDLAAENAPLLAPLSDGVAGKDISLDPEFERVKAELDKAASMAGGNPDWQLVHAEASRLLRSRTHDLRLATWLMLALTHLRALRGFASGLHLFHGLITQQWDAVYPDVRRLRGRANLYAWLTEQLTPLLENQPIDASHREVVHTIDQLFTDIETFLGERLGEHHPGPGRLRGVVRNLVRALPPEAPVAPPPAPPAPGTTQSIPPIATPSLPPVVPPPPRSAPQVTHAPPSAPSLPIASAPDAATIAANVDEAFAAARRALFDIADALRRSDRANAVGYRLARYAAWMGITEIPDGPVTEFESPDRVLRGDFEAACASGDDPEIIEHCERLLRVDVLWLDPHRATATALSRLGLKAAADEVAHALLDFVARFPNITELQYANEIPFASIETKSWLEGERHRLGRSGGGGAPVDSVDEVIRPAMELAAAGQLPDAMGSAVRAAHQTGVGRDRFRALLKAGRLALDKGEAELARAMLEGLLEDVSQHALERWDPSLCAELYRTLIEALRAQTSENVDHFAREALLFDKLCRLDPRAALLLARR